MYVFVLWSRLSKSWIFDLAVGKQMLAQEASLFILFFYAVFFEIIAAEQTSILLVSFLISWCCFAMAMLHLKAQIHISVFSNLNAANYSKEHKAVQMIVSLYEHAEDANFDTY